MHRIVINHTRRTYDASHLSVGKPLLPWKPNNQKAEPTLPLRTGHEDEIYGNLIDKYTDKDILTEILDSILLDDGRSAIEVCSKLSLFTGRKK